MWVKGYECYVIVRDDIVLSTEEISKEKTTTEAIKKNCFKRCLNGVILPDCFCGIWLIEMCHAHYMRMRCARTAHELRSWCAPKWTFAEALQNNCRGIAIASAIDRIL